MGKEIVTITVSNLDYLEKYTTFVKRMAKIDSDAGWQGFFKKKVWDLANEITNQRLVSGTTNDIYIDLYKSSHKIKDEENGFILYNDANVVANTTHPEDYPEGMFSVALAFEYGVGVQYIGRYNGDRFTPWTSMGNTEKKEYWYLPNDNIPNALYDANDKPITFGHAGFEIYRTIADEVEKRVADWVMEYFEKGFEV